MQCTWKKEPLSTTQCLLLWLLLHSLSLNPYPNHVLLEILSFHFTGGKSEAKSDHTLPSHTVSNNQTQI